MRAGHVMSVTGPVELQELGPTLIHEHVFIDLRFSWQEPADERKLHAKSPIRMDTLGMVRRDVLAFKDNLLLTSFETMAEELDEYKKVGGRTLVDTTSIGLSPNPRALSKISKRTGLIIIAGCGYYTEKSRPSQFANMTVAEVAGTMINDIDKGISGTDVKAGIIGEIGIHGPKVSKGDKKLLLAVARAHLETNVPITIHQGWIPTTDEGLKALDILEEEGVALHHVTMSHMDEKTMKIREEAATRGAYVNFDHWGLECYVDQWNARFISDGERIEKVREMVDVGLLSKVMFGQDVCLKIQLKRFGGFGYGHILRHIKPALLRSGISEKAFRTIMIDNPRSFFSG